jgi:EAL domain-containing protein (putative c-di-GMP-specific phosphodiesterase class I)
VCPNDTTNLKTMLKQADQAMYKAKKMGRNCFSYFTAVMQQEAQSRQQLIRDLRIALDNNQFEIYYQPIADCQTTQIHKAEALLRWHHPVLGMIEPDHFITLAEESGLIIQLGNWVFEQAAKNAKKWAKINPDIQISINKSPIQFHTASEHKKWLAFLQEIQLNEKHIAIEMTEGVLMEGKEKIVAQLDKYREAGIEISIDDFGTGYSSLSYLQKFSIDYLKIDKSFIQHIGDIKNDLILSEAIIVMAHKLGIKVIAEGVENNFQLKKLQQAECDYIQGYIISTPVSADKFEQLIYQNN